MVRVNIVLTPTFAKSHVQATVRQTDFRMKASTDVAGGVGAQFQLNGYGSKQWRNAADATDDKVKPATEPTKSDKGAWHEDRQLEQNLNRLCEVP
ncbi:hypothetical protein ACLKA7_003037 [Drosophila subpalustris]